MTNPTAELSWTVLSNLSTQTEGTALAQNRAILFGIKEALTNPSLPHPWTVALSSDGTTADASDNWSAASDVNWGTPTHSWIVFAIPGWDDFQVCIDLLTSDNDTLGFVVSPSGDFSGGTTSARPTASDEIVVDSARMFTINSIAQNYDGVISVAQSSTGEQTRVMAMAQTGVAMSVWWFDVPKWAKDGWSNPKVLNILPYSAFEYDRTGGNNENIFNCNNADSGLVHNYNSDFADADSVGLLAPHNDGTQLIEYDASPSQNADGNYHAWPMVMGNADEGAMCELYDCYATNRQTVAYAPSDGSNDWICLRNMVLPWADATEMTTTASPVNDIDLDEVVLQQSTGVTLDVAAPVIANVLTEGNLASTARAAREVVWTGELTDVSPGLLRVLVSVRFAGQSSTLLAYDGTQFLAPFDDDASEIVGITDGVRINMRQRGGWRDSFEVFVQAIDSHGNIVGSLG